MYVHRRERRPFVRGGVRGYQIRFCVHSREGEETDIRVSMEGVLAMPPDPARMNAYV